MKSKTSKQRLQNRLKQGDIIKYTEEYNKDDINHFAKYIFENYFNKGPKCQIMNNYLGLHDKSAQLILFQRIHPQKHYLFQKEYVFMSIKINDYFTDDKTNDDICELLKAKQIYEKSLTNGDALLFVVVEFPRKDDFKAADISYILSGEEHKVCFN